MLFESFQTGTGREELLVLLCSTYQWPVPSAPRACHRQWPAGSKVYHERLTNKKKYIASSWFLAYDVQVNLYSPSKTICTNTMSHASKETINIPKAKLWRRQSVTRTRLKGTCPFDLCFITYISVEERKSRCFSRSPHITF